MQFDKKYRGVVIGGSAGSFQSVVKILSSIPKKIDFPIFLTLHRLKHVRSGFVEALSIKSNIEIREPADKEHFRGGIAYLAPANYHMYLEFGNIISLTTEETVNHSRPAIDLTFKSAAFVMKENLLGIILSGANHDGALGMKAIKDAGGTTIVHSPDDCQIKTMPKAAIAAAEVEYIYNLDEIIRFLKYL